MAAGKADGPTESFGGLLRQHRRAANLTQEALAERAGISARAVGDLERDRGRSPRQETLALLANALGLSDEERRQLIAAARPESEAREVAAHPPPAPGTPSAEAAASRVPPLPVPPTPLVGRESAVAEVANRLRDPAARLLTLTGPGGVGKTRLALAVAESIRDLFASGVWFVELAAISDPGQVASAITQHLEVREGAAQPYERLAAYLREREVLLVLDNFEQVEQAAPLVSRLLAACPYLKILVTSRIVLQLRGEYEIPVSPLALPDEDAPQLPELLSQVPAVQLFVQCARAVRADFTLSAADAPAVAAICRRLDGLPLAIELTVVRLRVLPPQALQARLEQGVPLPAGGLRDLPARQHTMHSTIAWSHSLLGLQARVVFRRLAVFAGGWTLEAAEAICEGPTIDHSGVDVLDSLTVLRNSSLVSMDEHSGEARFTMLETVREYAIECLGLVGEGEERQRIRTAHAGYYLALAEQAEPALTGSNQLIWLKRLDLEYQNLRLALDWACDEGDSDLGLKLGWRLWRYWYIRGYLNEGRQWLGDILALRVSGTAEMNLARARATHGASLLALGQQAYAEAEVLAEESLKLCRAAEDQSGIAAALSNLGMIARHQKRYEQAQLYLEEVLAIDEALGNLVGKASVLTNLGNAATAQGNYVRAIALYEDSLALRRTLNDTWGSANTLCNLGGAFQRYGDQDRAGTAFLESLTLFEQAADQHGMAECIEGIALIEAARGSFERAVQLCASADVVRKALGVFLSQEDLFGHNQAMDAAERVLGPRAFDRAWAKGQALRLEQAVALARA